MKDGINWKSIKTVLLDMDGTLLDLHFDNYFWQEYLPVYWGKLNNMGADAAKAQLKEWYSKEAGTLSWYCLDFWTDRLNFDVLKLKADVEHLIQYRPHAETFLKKLSSETDYSVIMVTNAHENLIKMKVDKTGIDIFFERIISSHTIGHAKEDQAFWQKLRLENPFEPDQTILIDDNLTVLRAAREFGIKNLLTISEPDSKNGKQDPEEFYAIESFQDINF
jgi:HAD superfamily hydrolase (TIGR01509 family)